MRCARRMTREAVGISHRLVSWGRAAPNPVGGAEPFVRQRGSVHLSDQKTVVGVLPDFPPLAAANGLGRFWCDV